VTRVVVDASVAVKWFLPETLSVEARSLLRGDYDLQAPDLLWAELGNTLWKRFRRGELDEETAKSALHDFGRFPVRPARAHRWTEAALDLAIRHGVTVYDGLYLAVAAGHRLRLVTADRRLYEACRQSVLSRLVVWIGEVR
jgi:predicted nucleic acid-binding protein